MNRVHALVPIGLSPENRVDHRTRERATSALGRHDRRTIPPSARIGLESSLTDARCADERLEWWGGVGMAAIGSQLARNGRADRHQLVARGAKRAREST